MVGEGRRLGILGRGTYMVGDTKGGGTNILIEAINTLHLSRKVISHVASSIWRTTK